MSKKALKVVDLTVLILCLIVFNNMCMCQKIYDVKSASIKYLMSNTFPPTTDTIIRIFGEYGRKEKIEKTNYLSMESRIIFLDSIKYMMVDSLQAIKSLRQRGFSLQNLDFSFLESGIGSGNYKIVSKQKEQFLSKQCIKYEFINTELNIVGMVWVWKKIPLKAEIKIDKNIQQFSAIYIDTTSTINDNVFVLPSNIEILDPEF